MKGIYLCAYKAYHPNFVLDYNDVVKTSEYVNVFDDCLNVDISKYDFVIATPPCNYWSRGNYRREISEYSQNTKKILPNLLKKLIYEYKGYWIVENVRNFPLFEKNGLMEYINSDIKIITHGRHTYWTNVDIDISHIPQVKDNTNFINPKLRQGGKNVHDVIEYFLSVIHKKAFGRVGK